MNNLALALAAAGQSAEAIRLYEDTLELQSAKLGKGHPDSLPCLFNLGLAYRDVGQAEKALPRLSEAVDVARKNLGRDHPTTIMMESNLGRVLVTVGNPAVAEPLFLEILQWERRKFEDAADPSKLAPERLILAGMLADLGGCYISGRKYAQAETVLRESLSIREKEQPDAWNRFNVASLLGAALLGQEKFIEAEPLLLSGYEEMVRRAASIPPSAAFRVREAGEKVGKLYEAWGKPEKASEWRKKLEDAGGGKNS
jgi:tetratricopeptide (TPR) repeat protein